MGATPTGATPTLPTMGCIDSVQDFVGSVIDYAIASDKLLEPQPGDDQGEARAIVGSYPSIIVRQRDAVREACPADIATSVSQYTSRLTDYGVERNVALRKAAGARSVDAQLSLLPTGTPALATRDTVNALLALEPRSPTGIDTLRQLLPPPAKVAPQLPKVAKEIGA